MTPVSGAVVLQAANLDKRYAAVHALRSANLTMRAGEVHALMGTNGAGKSTLVKILTGAVMPDDGEVLLDGMPVPLAIPVRRSRPASRASTKSPTWCRDCPCSTT